MDEKAKILIVHDELTTRVNLQLILAKEDYEVQAVASGREALRILAKSPIDVIFTDLRMKGLLTGTAHLSPETIVVFLGSHPSVKAAVKAIPLDVYDYLVKPYEAEAVKRAARRAVEHKRLTARLQELSVLQARLKTSEEQYCTLIESVSDLMLSLDAQGRLSFVNRALQSVAGFRPEELIGRHFLDFIVPEDRPKAAAAFARLMNGDETIREVDITILNQAGERETLQILAYPLWRNGQIVGITGLARDITERNRALEQEQDRARQLVAIKKISAKVAATLDLDTVIEQVCALVRQHFGYDVVLAFLMDKKKNQLVCKEGAIGYAGRPLSEHSLKIGEGIIGWVAQTGETLLANDVSQEPRFHCADQLPETRSELAIPMKARDQVVGVLDVESAQVNAFGPDDVMILESLADEVAVAIQNARLYAERKLAEESEREQRALAEALCDTAATLNSTLNFDEVLDRILVNIARVVPSDTAAVVLVESGIARAVRHRGFAERGLEDWIANLRSTVSETANLRNMTETGLSLVIPDTKVYPGWIDMPEVRWIRSYVGAPILIKEQVVGFLSLTGDTPGFFNPAHAARLQVFANQAAMALENARLLAETGRRAEQFALLYYSGLALDSMLELRVQLASLFRIAIKALKADRAEFFRVDAVSDEICFEAAFGYRNEEIPERLRAWRFSSGEEVGVVGWVAEHRVPSNVGDAPADPRYVALDPEVRSGLWVPVQHEDQLLGVLAVLSTRANAFTQQDERFLVLIANQAAVALQNAQHLEEINHRIRELDALNKIATSTNSTLDLERVLDLTMQEVKDVLGVEVCSLMLLEEQTQELVFKVSLGPGAEQAKQMRLGLNRGIAGWVAREGKPDLVLDVRTDPRWYPEIDSRTGFVTKSILAVPLKSKEKVIGVIEAINKVQGAFTADNLQLLNSISMVVTTAIENARLFGELNTAYQEMATSHAQVLESRNTLRALFDGINDSICIIGQDLQIKAINRTAAAAVREEPRNLIGRNCHTVLCEPNVLCDDCPINETFRTGKPTLKTERHVGELATTRESEINIFPLKDAAGVVNRVIYIAQDVTEKRKLEASLVQSARLSAVGELAAGVTHEIGNPLTAVIGNAQMLLEALEPGDPRYRMAQLIERAGLRMEKVVSDLLNFSRQEKYQFAPTDLNASIENALSLVAYLLERDNIQVTKEFQANLPLISASTSHLQTIWANLLLNARDAIPKGKKGRIQITTRMSEDRRSVEALFADNGSGIEAETMAKIFDPFFTTKPRGKGTGLGLYVSQTIIARHNGTIQAQSQVGEGCAFVVALPLEGKAKADDAEMPAA